MSRPYRRKKKKDSQDRIYTFRLSPNDPEEAQAIAILERYLSSKDQRGRLMYSLREIITQALMTLSGVSPDDPRIKLDNLTRTLDEAVSILREIQAGGIHYSESAHQPKREIAISSSYLENLGKGINT